MNTNFVQELRATNIETQDKKSNGCEDLKNRNN